MKYTDFEAVMSSARMNRYLVASGNDTKKGMTLYRYNLKLSQELFTIISCFEIALRNKINQQAVLNLGNHWLRDSVVAGGVFSTRYCRRSAEAINDSISKLGGSYTHDKLVAELGFGFWRYMFAQHQFVATGSRMLNIFPSRPFSTRGVSYNQSFVFNQLMQINSLRNRLAHHEPVCFQVGRPIKDTTYVRQQYTLIKQLFQWMSIDEGALLYGLDHVTTVCNQIDAL